MSGGVALLDYDGDGWLDIYFTNAPSVSMALAGKKARSALYRNNHDGTFTDVTDKAGVGYPCWAMGAAVADTTNDGRPDLLVTCFGGVVLYHNNGDGTFTDVTARSGLAKDTGWATGATFGDYDGDGFPDLFVPHYVDLDLHDLPQFGSVKTCQYHDIAVQCGPRGLKGSPDTLYHNNRDGTFTEVATQAGVNDPQHYFGLGAIWTDFANDGKLDLFVANDGESNYLYRNQGNGHFKDIASEAGVAFSEDGLEQANMGLAVGDYENKGRMSIAISHFSGRVHGPLPQRRRPHLHRRLPLRRHRPPHRALRRLGRRLRGPRQLRLARPPPRQRPRLPPGRQRQTRHPLPRTQTPLPQQPRRHLPPSRLPRRATPWPHPTSAAASR